MSSDEAPAGRVPPGGVSPGRTNEAGVSVAYTCPQCGELLYSHRSRMCGHCGALQPPEAVLSDEAEFSRREERRWAQDLADGFATSARTRTHAEPKPRTAEEEIATAEAAVHRMSCASEFKYRKRPSWIYTAGCGVTLLMFAGILSAASHVLPLTRDLLLPFGMFAAMNILGWYFMWRRSMPICPNCHQNIRFCPAQYCWCCGKALSHQRCTDCKVDNSWTGMLQPYQNGTFRRIECCPGCGVELDTWMYRRQVH